MDKKLMLEQLISHFTDGNKAQFAAKIGISPQNLSKWLNRGTFDAEIIFANCENVSPEWLLSGRNEMLMQNQQNGNHQQNGNSKQNGNAEILALCCELVANYRQRDAVMAKLVEILG